MKKVILPMLLGATLLSAGCAGLGPMGIIYTDASLPRQAESNEVGTKHGTAMCTSILGLILTGDCSIETAAKQAGINNISSVNTDVKNILGVYATYTTTVSGN